MAKVSASEVPSTALSHLEHMPIRWRLACQVINYGKPDPKQTVPYSEVQLTPNTWHLCWHFQPIPPWPAWIAIFYFQPSNALESFLTEFLTHP